MRLGDELRRAQPSDALGAERRAYAIVEVAWANREAQPRTRRYARAVALVVVLLAVVAAALSPPGEAVLDSIRDAVGRERPAAEPARPLLLDLPASGRILVTSPSGPWVVNASGRKRLLGDYREASWSPGGLFVVAARRREIVALTPEGTVRWTLPQRARVRFPRWAPSGFRIAYLAGTTLRVVVGDGTGDRSLARDAAAVPAAWRPGDRHVLAYVTRRGEIRVRNTDTGQTLLRSAPGPVPLGLTWTADGRTLVVLDRRGLRRFTGPRPSRLSLVERRGVAVAAAPTGRRVAVIARNPATRRSELLVVGRHIRRVFDGAGAFTDVAWSPDGRWLLIAWRTADQWVFIRSAGVERVAAVSRIARQFVGRRGARAAFPALGGWCCAASP